MTTYLVTGGAGFIGTNFVKLLIDREPQARIVVLDALTYSGNITSLTPEIERKKITFIKGDIADRPLVSVIMAEYRPQYIINFAAESHVDRSLDDATPFIRTNIEGTFTLLECARNLRKKELEHGQEPSLKMFVQISTDEVYGDLDIDLPWGERYEGREVQNLGRTVTRYGTAAFSEQTPVRPSSPYSSSKASADLIALAYHRSFGLPVVVTRCSNNYGPYQHPEKLIPLMINNIQHREPLPVYGQGTNVRDWIYVTDHAAGVLAAAQRGRAGQIYNFGGYSERRNIDVVKDLIHYVAALTDSNDGIDETLIQYVTDRPGHDTRYAIDASKAIDELGWRPVYSFEKGLLETVTWYLGNTEWLDRITDGSYRDYYSKMYSNR